jgi:hypothetical protein
MTKGLPLDGWLGSLCGVIAAWSAPGLVAQDAAAWQARLSGADAEVRQALVGVPLALEADCAGAVVSLLLRADANVRNEAVAWLLARPQVADRVLPRLLALRSGADLEAARAAGPVVAFFARHRSLSLESLREQLKQPGRIHEVLERLAKDPDLESQLLPDLLACNPLLNVDPALRRLLAREPGRFEAELRAALTRPSDTDSQLVFLAGLPDLSEESLQLLDARFGSVTGRTSQPIAEALTKAVLQGRALQANGLASGLANWSASLRGIGNQQNRGAIFAVLVRQALPSVLRREFESLPLSPGVVSLLPSMGRHASEFAERLVDPLARVEAGSLSAYATAVAELAPATKACAVPMLAYLQSEQRDEVQLALFALGELGNEASGVMEAIAACLAHGDEEVRLDAVVALARLGLGAHRSQIAVLAENGPPAVRTLASFVLASTADGVLPNETLLEEAAGLDRRRALVATVALASRTVTSGQVAALLVREDRPSTWADHWLQRSLLSAIGRQMTSRPVDAQAIAYLRETTFLSVQDWVRIYDWLLREPSPQLAPLGQSLLFLRLEWPGNEFHVLEAFAARGEGLAGLAPQIAVFVRHPELAVREAAIACLHSMAGPDASAQMRSAQQGHDPWPAWSSLRKSYTPSLAAAFVRNAKNPAWMRAHFLRSLARGGDRGDEWRDLLPLASDADEMLAAAAAELVVRRPELWTERNQAGLVTVRDESVLRLFAGGSAALRAQLGGALRTTLQEAWPMALALRVLDLPLAASAFSRDGRFLWDSRGPTQAAVLQLRNRAQEVPIEWYQQKLATAPVVALRVLTDGQARPAAALLPQLRAVARNARFAALATQVMLRVQGDAQASAGEDLALSALEQRVDLSIARVRAGKAVDLGLLREFTELPWRERPATLAPLAERIADLWRAAPEGQRVVMFQLVTRMGPLAAFAVPDFERHLTVDSPQGEFAAERLIALGRPDLVRAWLRRLPPERWLGMRTAPVAELGVQCAAERLTARFVEAADAALPPLWQELTRHLYAMAPADRDAVANRLLAQREANPGGPWVGSFRELGPSLGDAARANFTAFLARRKALPQRPDPLAEKVLAEVFPAMPALGITGMREGLARVVVVLSETQGLPMSSEIVIVATDLVDLVAACEERANISRGLLPEPGTADPYLGHLVGALLARAGVAPVPAVLQKLADATRREFALALLSALGDVAQRAAPAVAQLAADATAAERQELMRVLVRLGVSGTEQACELAAKEPALLPHLYAVFSGADDACRLSVARWLAAQGPDQAGAEGLLGALQEGLTRSKDARTRSAIQFLLMQQADRVLGAGDWLGLASLEPAVLRQRAVQALADRASGALPCGALAELLHDVDRGVRTAACLALLAQGERVVLCRQPLLEFAAVAEPELAARIREALAAAK